MWLKTPKHTLALALSAALICILCAGISLAQEKIKAAGTMTMTDAKADTMLVGNTEGHFLSLMRSTGTNAATGENKIMDGAQAVNVSTSDLVKGSGPHNGYLILTLGENSVIIKWKGKVTTAEGKDGPQSSFAGTFNWTGGTGQFAKIKGSGTFKGHYTSPTAYTADWSGEYSLGD
jgi:hypothetical protein